MVKIKLHNLQSDKRGQLKASRFFFRWGKITWSSLKASSAASPDFRKRCKTLIYSKVESRALHRGVISNPFPLAIVCTRRNQNRPSAIYTYVQQLKDTRRYNYEKKMLDVFTGTFTPPGAAARDAATPRPSKKQKEISSVRRVALEWCCTAATALGPWVRGFLGPRTAQASGPYPRRSLAMRMAESERPTPAPGAPRQGRLAPPRTRVPRRDAAAQPAGKLSYTTPSFAYTCNRTPWASYLLPPPFFYELVPTYVVHLCTRRTGERINFGPFDPTRR